MTNSFPRVPAGDLVTRQVLCETPEMMVVSFRFEKGGEGALHSHPHIQSTFVRAGRFRFTMADESFEVGPGDTFITPSDVIHGCVCLEDGELIDTFTPRRDDFL